MASPIGEWKNQRATSTTARSPTTTPTSGTIWFTIRFGSTGMDGGPGGTDTMTGGVGAGVCVISSIAFIYAVLDTSVSSGNRRPRRQLFRRLLFCQEPLGKIYPLGQFRHLPPQFFDRGAQFLMIPTLRLPLGAQAHPLGVRLAHRRQRDHPGEKAPNRHDRDEDADDGGVHTQLLRGSGRAASPFASS